jgi:hypothetical protein
MRKRLIALGFVAAIAAAVPVMGQAMAADCPPAPSDWSAPGPFPVTVEPGGNAHTPVPARSTRRLRRARGDHLG